MEIVLKKLPKELLENDPYKRTGRRLLNGARKDVVHFLLNASERDQITGISGFLIDSDIELIESITKKKVHIHNDSGDLFYKLIK